MDIGAVAQPPVLTGNDFSNIPAYLFIGGRRPSAGKRRQAHRLLDSSTEKRLASVANATVKDDAKAVDATSAVAAGWAAHAGGGKNFI